MGTLDDGFLSQVVLGELPEPSGWMLFVFVCNLCINCSGLHIPFSWRKGSTKGGHDFRSFGSDPVIIAVLFFLWVYVVLDDTVVAKVRQEKLERLASIV